MQWEGLGGLYKVGCASAGRANACTWVMQAGVVSTQACTHLVRAHRRQRATRSCIIISIIINTTITPNIHPSSQCVPPNVLSRAQGVSSPLAGQMLFRASLFGAFGESKRYLATNSDGTMRPLRPADFYKVWCVGGPSVARTGSAV